MEQIIPFLTFNGNCADTMRFYAKVLGGKLDLMTYGQSPLSEQTPAGARDTIMHARLMLEGSGTLYAADRLPSSPYQGIHGISMTLNYNSVAQAERVFNLLAEGGKVTMALKPTFWAQRFGMVVDKFGSPWGINGELNS